MPCLSTFPSTRLLKGRMLKWRRSSTTARYSRQLHSCMYHTLFTSDDVALVARIVLLCVSCIDILFRPVHWISSKMLSDQQRYWCRCRRSWGSKFTPGKKASLTWQPPWFSRALLSQYLQNKLVDSSSRQMYSITWCCTPLHRIRHASWPTQQWHAWCLAKRRMHAISGLNFQHGSHVVSWTHQSHFCPCNWYCWSFCPKHLWIHSSLSTTLPCEPKPGRLVIIKIHGL